MFDKLSHGIMAVTGAAEQGAKSANQALQKTLKKGTDALKDLSGRRCAVCGLRPSQEQLFRLVSRWYCKQHQSQVKQRLDSIRTSSGDWPDPYEVIDVAIVEAQGDAAQYLLSLLKERAMDLGGDAVIRVQYSTSLANVINIENLSFDSERAHSVHSYSHSGTHQVSTAQGTVIRFLSPPSAKV
ncbi:MAG: hypothetical protein RBU37_02760 [Myxococcota bacterium]|jgi:uncharacterized protein YbjQ (UPF0145 family)|nr:hypothetical protein [Myxococcota bacterium]